MLHTSGKIRKLIQVPVEITFKNKNYVLFVVKYNDCLIWYCNIRRVKNLCANSMPKWILNIRKVSLEYKVPASYFVININQVLHNTAMLDSCFYRQGHSKVLGCFHFCYIPATDPKRFCLSSRRKWNYSLYSRKKGCFILVRGSYGDYSVISLWANKRQNNDHG